MDSRSQKAAANQRRRAQPGPIKPVTGVPSVIEHRIWWLIPLALWTGGVWLSLHAHIRDIRGQAILVAAEGARNMFRMVELTRNWNSSHGGVYVPVSPRIQPNPYLKVPDRDVVTTGRIALTLVNPAYMTRLITQMAESKSGAIFRLTSLDPIRPQNAPDEWERSSLLKFENGVEETLEVTASGEGTPMLRYMAPLLVKESCLKCHAAQGYEVGDIRGGISVSQPYSPIEAATATAIRQAVVTYLVVWLGVLLLGWALLELLSRRWMDLAGKITELEETRGELVQSEKMASLGRMVAGFAHEVNTPIGIGIGASSHAIEVLDSIDRLLEAEDVSEEALRARLGTLREAGNLALGNLRRAADMVQSFKRTSVDQTSEQEREFVLGELVQDVFRSLRSTFKRSSIELVSECPSETTLYGPAGILVQVLNNLLLNSFRHAFDDGSRRGKIVVTAGFEPSGALWLECADNGKGIPEQAAKHLFEPFFTTRRGQGGSGLGLYIVYNLVSQASGGSISVDSAPGGGARFRVVFGRQQFRSVEDVAP